MGLAASQARLLFITMRQNDVSAKMQKISNDKLTLARDEDEVDTKYNKMLNAKVFKKAGTEEDISYSNMMGSAAGASGETSPTFIMKNGHVVLDDNYMNKLGINSSALQRGYGTSADFGVNKADFISKMTNISVDDVNSALSGATSFSKSNEYKTFIDEYGTKPSGSSTTEKVQFTYDKLYDTSENSIGLNTTEVGKSALSGLSGIWLVGTDQKGTSHDAMIKKVQDKISDLGLAVKQLMGYDTNSATSETRAIDNAVSATQAKYNSCSCSQKDNGDPNGKVGLFEYRPKKTHEHKYKVDADVLKEEFYKNLQKNLNNKDGNKNDNLQVTKTSEAKNDKGKTLSEWQAAYDTAKTNWQDTVGANISQDQLAKVNFYNEIYDKAGDGWVYDNGVTNSSTLQAGLQNGTYTIGESCQRATNSDELVEVDDPEAQAKAKHYWDVEMQKIKRKEDKMDTDLQKLQTEYSGLTSDAESVKSILNANIQKSFTYCQNG